MKYTVMEESSVTVKYLGK